MQPHVNLDTVSKKEKLRLYVDHIAPILNKEGLFSDGTEQYRSPMEPEPGDKVKIRFRALLGNVEQVFLIVNDVPVAMKVCSSDDIFDYYEAEITVGEERVEYYFQIRSGNAVCYYNNVGVVDSVEKYYNFYITPGYKTPDWAKGAVFYQIFVDRFYNGDTTNDVDDNEYYYIGEGTKKIRDWSKYPAQMGVREFYGGDIKGVWKKLDYLQELGVEVIYLNPIFVSPSNHKYDIQDYDYVDPHYGVIVKDGGENLPEGEKSNTKATKFIQRVTAKENLEASNKLFADFVAEVHRRGMKVVLDGVFNHCGSFNKWMDREKIYDGQDDYDKGAYVSKDSPYHTFFKFLEESWPDNGKYDGWWGHDTLPKLNYEESPLLVEDIMRIGRKWVSAPYNADGWRLDVAADLGHSPEFNHKFWKEFRKNVKEANPDAIILAEHYGDPGSWLQGDEWDTVMNYDAFMEPVTWFLTGMEKHSDEYREDLLGSAEHFWASMRHYMTRFNTQSLQVAMNELSNHDHSRFLTRTNRKVGRVQSVGSKAADENVNTAIMRLAVIMQMTWPGAPTIYYGDEAGVCGWTDPDSRRTYPWGKEDKELIEFHKEIIRIHKDYEALKRGSLIQLAGKHKFLAYGRFLGKQKFVVLINSSEKEMTERIPIWKVGVDDNEQMVRLIETKEDGYDLRTVVYRGNRGFVDITMPPVSAMVLKTLEL